MTINNYDIYKNQFESFKSRTLRDQQVAALDFIRESTKPITCLCLPCGSGKSGVGMIQLARSGGGMYLVSSKQLQAQLNHDFTQEDGAEIMFGRNNFACRMHTDLTCADCTHTKEHPCPKKHSCLYEIKKNAVLNAKYKVLNYHYFMFEGNYIGKFSDENQVVICDEADAIEGILGNFINLHIPSHLTSKTKMRFPSKKTAGAEGAIDTWIEWANTLKTRLLGEITKLESKVKAEETKINGKPEIYIKSKNKINSTISQINIFTESVDKDWLMEVKKEHWSKDAGQSLTFKPRWMTEELGEKYFWRHGAKFILMSATFQPIQVMSKTLGRPVGDFDYLDLDSTFPAKNRMSYSTGYTNLSSKTFDDEIPKANALVQYVLHNNYKAKPFGKPEIEYDTTTKKGIIHTVSWKANKYIVENDKSGRIITHNSNNKDEVLSRFYQSKEPLVLASPSITRGVDLKYDLCNFVIWLKAPYLNLGDKLTSSRAFSKPIGDLWYSSVAANEVVQGVGRGSRAMDDFVVCIMVDKKIQDLVKRKALFPEHFLSAYEIDAGGVDYTAWYDGIYDGGHENCDEQNNNLPLYR